jgi:hypothetical protein
MGHPVKTGEPALVTRTFPNYKSVEQSSFRIRSGYDARFFHFA